MKINIVGVTGSGKTTLAKKISQETGIKFYCTDDIFFRKLKGKKGLYVRKESQSRKIIQDILEKESWIVEGINLIPDILKNADRIIWIKSTFYKALYRQWKRYITDQKQRKEHGFKNNLKLTRYLYRIYFQEIDEKRMDDVMYLRMKKLEKMLQAYKDKLEIR